MKTSTSSPTTDAEFDFDDDNDLTEDTATKAQRFAADLEAQFATIPMAIFADVRAKRINHRDVCLYLHLLAKLGKNRTLFWGIDRLALLTGTNATNIKDSLRRLVACGHIKRRKGISTTHTICMTRLLPGYQGTEGIRVKGRTLGELRREAQSEPTTARPSSGCLPPIGLKSLEYQPERLAATVEDDGLPTVDEISRALYPEPDSAKAGFPSVPRRYSSL